MEIVFIIMSTVSKNNKASKKPVESDEFFEQTKNSKDLRVKISRILDRELIPNITDIILEYYIELVENNIDYIIYSLRDICRGIYSPDRIEVILDILNEIYNVNIDSKIMPKFVGSYQKDIDNPKNELIFKYSDNRFKKFIDCSGEECGEKYGNVKYVSYHCPQKDFTELKNIINTQTERKNGICFKGNYLLFDPKILLCISYIMGGEQTIDNIKIINSGHLRVMIVECE